MPKEKAKIVYRPMPTLNIGEKKILRSLTNDDLIERKTSLFKRWIDKYSKQDTMHTAIVYCHHDIIGWAAANMGDDWNCGLIGVFIQQEHRRKGYAKKALETLLPKLKELYPEWPEYLCYMKEKQNLFAPIVKRSGFKDMVRYNEEYQERYFKATSNISD